MEIRQVWAVYWSATGNSRTVAEAIAGTLAEKLNCLLRVRDITRPENRAESLNFAPGDLAVIALPTYAGKLPNKMLPYLKEQLAGNGALAVPVVTFGNRSYDNALAELAAVLEQNGFRTVAGAAFVCRHAFSDALAPGRPNEEDLRQARDFAAQAAERVAALPSPPKPVAVPGDAAAPYYVPKGTDGLPARFLKAKPKTAAELCVHCGRCVRLCPMGAIEKDGLCVSGTCIKCQACVRACRAHAKFFDDAAFLSHVAMLEQNFTRRKENELFF